MKKDVFSIEYFNKAVYIEKYKHWIPICDVLFNTSHYIFQYFTILFAFYMWNKSSV